MANASPDSRPQPKVRPKGSKTCTWSPTTSQTPRTVDNGAVFLENGDRPAYVNSIAVGKDGTVYTLSRVTEKGVTRGDLIGFPGPLKQ